jgi:hypothetical protein
MRRPERTGGGGGLQASLRRRGLDAQALAHVGSGPSIKSSLGVGGTQIPGGASLPWPGGGSGRRSMSRRTKCSGLSQACRPRAAAEASPGDDGYVSSGFWPVKRILGTQAWDRVREGICVFYPFSKVF